MNNRDRKEICQNAYNYGGRVIFKRSSLFTVNLENRGLICPYYFERGGTHKCTALKDFPFPVIEF